MNGRGIYQNGFSDQQYDCALHLSEATLHIYLENKNKDLLIWNTRTLRSCEWEGPQLVLTYGPSAQQTLKCEGALAEKIYRTWSGQEVFNRPKQNSYKGIISAAILLFIIVSGIILLALFLFLPWIGEKAVALIPVETEVKIGENIAKVYEQQNELNDSATYYLNQFVKQLDLDDTYKIDAKVIESREINAFAVPGGKIFVYSGLLKKMNSYEELVALLGHEVTHVANRHSLKSICRSAATGVAISSIFGDVNGISAVILTKADEFKQLDYSRSLETEADDNGMTIMLDNKVDPKGMPDLLELLKKEGSETPEFMKYLSTHPDTEARIENSSSHRDVRKIFPKNEKLQNSFSKLKRSI